MVSNEPCFEICYRNVASQERDPESEQVHKEHYQQIVDHIPIALYGTSGEHPEFFCLVRSHASLDCMINTFPGGIVLLDIHGRIGVVNRFIADFLARPVEEIVDQLCTTLAYSPEMHRLCDWALEALGDGLPRKQRVHLVDAQGAVRVLDLEAFPLTQDNRHVVIYMVDVADRIRYEAEAIEHARFAASAELAEIVAHELNTPLQAIESCLHLVSSADPEDQAIYLRIAHQEIQRAGGILRQFLDLFRPGMDVRTQIDIGLLIERVLLLAGNNLARQNIEVTCDLAPDLHAIHWYSDEIAQVLLSLVLNAAQSMPYGGSLRIRGYLNTTDQDAGVAHYLVIAIEDTGSEMHSDLQSSIYMSALNSKAGGFSLVVSRKLIVAHGGDLTVRSDSGAGNTYTLTLPLTMPA